MRTIGYDSLSLHIAFHSILFTTSFYHFGVSVQIEDEADLHEHIHEHVYSAVMQARLYARSYLPLMDADQFADSKGVPIPPPGLWFPIDFAEFMRPQPAYKQLVGMPSDLDVLLQDLRVSPEPGIYLITISLFSTSILDPF